MTWPREVALDVNLVATEVCLCLALSTIDGVLNRGLVVHDFHAAATAAERGLDGNWPTVAAAELDDLVGALGELGGARHDGCAAGQRGLAAADLVAHDIDSLGWWPDEGDAHLGDGSVEVGVLAEEAVARVHAIGAAEANCVEDGLGVEVALCCGLSAECVCLVGETHMQRVSIEFGIDRNGCNAQFSGGPNDSDSNFSTVGDEYLLQHGSHDDRSTPLIAT